MRTAKHLCVLADEGRDFHNWYTLAKTDLERVCKQKEYDFDRFVDVLAITSPRVAVVRNIRVALHYMDTGKWSSGTIRATRAAMAHYEDTGEIRGPKTSAFARALKGDPDAIVLDVWMSKAFEIDQLKFSNRKIRAECERRICKAARYCNMKPAELQAAVWAAIVRRYKRNAPMFNVSDELTLFD